ncbi:hypothetical protein SAMN02910356_00501 [Selenomonas sp. GACV-9]|uniref:hypothetical protein n=1 Tax=Selenomonas sp. GACV-9 TaxID=3158782 RepID=UPI0008F17F4D|nr:hypothetical protein SAMN02910356_00501 [Selenomonas ruminantium]
MEDRVSKIQVLVMVLVMTAAIGLVAFFGAVEYSKQQLLDDSLAKGKAMLAEQDYQSARVYLSLFDEKGKTETGYNLYGFTAAMIAYQTYLGTGDINQLQVASDYLSGINMGNLAGYTGKAQELKGKVDECLASYQEQVEAQQQAEAAAAAAEEERKNPKTAGKAEKQDQPADAVKTPKKAEPAKSATAKTQKPAPAENPGKPAAPKDAK